MRHRLLRVLFVVLVARPVSALWLGVHIRRKCDLPDQGPAIVVANHNSHLDTLVLLSLFPLRRVHQVRPVAAADYFMRNRLLAWLSLKLVGIVPVERKSQGNGEALAHCVEALQHGQILLLFPEGTRGVPEQLQELRSGIATLAERFPAIPVVPVYMQGLGKSMPKGSAIALPLFVDVYVGKGVAWSGDKAAYLTALGQRFFSMQEEHSRRAFHCVTSLE